MNALVLFELSEAQKQELQETAPHHRFTFTSSRAATQTQIEEADFILGNPRSGHLKNAIKLNWLQLESAGYERYVVPGVMPENARLTNARGAYGQAVSEHLIAMWLTLAKKLPLYRDNQSTGLWKDHGSVKAIKGSVVVVIGTGDIGSAFAVSAKALGAHIIGIRRQASIVPSGFDACYSLQGLNEILPKADVVVLAVPDSHETRALINKETLSLMKQDAILLNGGRGHAIDTYDLLEALACGQLYGVGLEVTDPEPLPADHPLWTIERVLITPHIAGGNHLQETYDAVFSICLLNLKAYLSGSPLHNQITE